MLREIGLQALLNQERRLISIQDFFVLGSNPTYDKLANQMHSGVRKSNHVSCKSTHSINSKATFPFNINSLFLQKVISSPIILHRQPTVLIASTHFIVSSKTICVIYFKNQMQDHKP
jgi:hypothetical protein